MVQAPRILTPMDTVWPAYFVHSPQYLDIGGSNNSMCFLPRETLGISTYNAFQAKLERRFRNGFETSWRPITYSKNLDQRGQRHSGVSLGFQSNEFSQRRIRSTRKTQKALSYQDTPHTRW